MLVRLLLQLKQQQQVVMNPESTATTTFDIVAAKAENVKVNFNESEFKYTGKQIKPTIKDITLNGVNVTKYF